jgi:phenylpropionate dioxygenase-like ring-hydroxylating dioxygenase large terminal subunit
MAKPTPVDTPASSRAVGISYYTSEAVFRNGGSSAKHKKHRHNESAGLQQTIFRREWVCVAREEQVPNSGDYRTVDVAGQPIIVVRLESGAIHAMSAICLHRSMPIAEGCGNAATFQCPYHRWKYRLNGELISAPYMEGTDALQQQKTLPAV